MQSDKVSVGFVDELMNVQLLLYLAGRAAT